MTVNPHVQIKVIPVFASKVLLLGSVLVWLCAAAERLRLVFTSQVAFDAGFVFLEIMPYVLQPFIFFVLGRYLAQVRVRIYETVQNFDAMTAKCFDESDRALIPATELSSRLPGDTPGSFILT